MIIENLFENLPYFTSFLTLCYSLYMSDVIYMYIFLSNLVTFGITGIIKRTIKQDRPNGRSMHGMPSGHCSYYFSFSTMLFYLSTNYIFTISIIISIIIAYQRIISKNHYKRQVIVGILLGYIISFLIYKFIIFYLINVKF